MKATREKKKRPYRICLNFDIPEPSDCVDFMGMLAENDLAHSMGAMRYPSGDEILVMLENKGCAATFAFDRSGGILRRVSLRRKNRKS